MKSFSVNESWWGGRYISIYSGKGDRYEDKIWVCRGFPERGEISFPCFGRPITLSNGDIVIHPSEECTVFFSEAVSEPGGSAEITQVEGGEIVTEGVSYRDGKEVAWALVRAPSHLPRVTRSVSPPKKAA